MVAGSYNVKPELNRILKAITKKHGDIAKDCVLESEYLRNFKLERLGNVVQKLKLGRTVGFNFSINQLETWYAIVNDAENVKIEVTWLRNVLHQVYDYVVMIRECQETQDSILLKIEQMALLNSEIDMTKVEMARLESEIEWKKAEIAKLNSEIELKKVEVGVLRLGIEPTKVELAKLDSEIKAYEKEETVFNTSLFVDLVKSLVSLP